MIISALARKALQTFQRLRKGEEVSREDILAAADALANHIDELKTCIEEGHVFSSGDFEHGVEWCERCNYEHDYEHGDDEF